ncbi:nuclear transport factor 2 family protein [Dactylosporangium roseum]|uniref:Nuclear transport factor 2 family protein n=1 Tax=Dactylosporangium roseum TaxID=47989 RepID=A0ABY5ZC92_9ACTN|nr:nuclear transport factor 2 family protein [Dactylosporangium roseum]UWZ39274.1 nuclear transport factor 2 family protein [Dactylosporangium roseum]
MLDEAFRKATSVQYAQRLNEGDVEGVLALFTDDVVFEDPVGGTPTIGKEALRRHLVMSVEHQVHETPQVSVTSMCDRFVVTSSKVVLRSPTVMKLHIIGVVEFNEEGLGFHVRAFWGMTDLTVGESPAGPMRAVAV